MSADKKIADRAYRLWEEAGRPDGRDLEHWLKAEAEMQPTKEKAVAKTKAPAKPKAAAPKAAAPKAAAPKAAAPKAAAKVKAKA